jgi:hypothetical protein
MSLRERGMHVFSVAAREGRVSQCHVAADARVARGRACRVSRFVVTLQRLKMNQKREVSRQTSRPQIREKLVLGRCHVDVFRASTKIDQTARE